MGIGYSVEQQPELQGKNQTAKISAPKIQPQAHNCSGCGWGFARASGAKNRHNFRGLGPIVKLSTLSNERKQ